MYFSVRHWTLFYNRSGGNVPDEPDPGVTGSIFVTTTKRTSSFNERQTIFRIIFVPLRDVVRGGSRHLARAVVRWRRFNPPPANALLKGSVNSELERRGIAPPVLVLGAVYMLYRCKVRS